MQWLFHQLGQHFLTAVFLGTRVFAVFAGICCVFYVNMTLNLEGEVREAFTVAALIYIGVAVVATTFLSMSQTTVLRHVFVALERGENVSAELKREAAYQAVAYPQINTTREAIIDPFITIIPICVTVWFWVHPPFSVMVQVGVAGFLGLACILLATFFVSERCLAPVVNFLQEHGVEFEFDSLPKLPLKLRLQIGFGITILVTAVMIGGLAIQRSYEIMNDPARIEQALNALVVHTVAVTFLAVFTGALLAGTVASSVTQRTDSLIAAMQTVQSGDLSQRVNPPGNDEIDTLARQFNLMVEQLDQNDQDLRVLTETLEQRVEEKTSELQRSMGQLEVQNRELEEAFRQLQQMQAQLVQSEKMTSLGQLVAGLAHEINNSINVVHNGIPALSNRFQSIRRLIDQRLARTGGAREDGFDKLFATVERLTEAIGEGAERTAKIVRDMKQFSHPGTNQSLSVDVNESLQRCLNLLQVGKLSQVEIETNFAENATACGALSQLDQVFLNILSNALDAMENKGTVWVATQVRAEVIEVSIQDSGPGIPPDKINRIFDPFFTTKPPGKGTGLGMSISYSIVKGFQGDLRCRSEPGKGAEFLMTIPRSSSKNNGMVANLDVVRDDLVQVK